MLIVFEGADGSGKSSVIDIVFAKLQSRGVCVSRFREPSKGPYGRRFRQMAKYPIGREYSNSLLIRDRIWDVRNNILPALKRGDIVLLDRYYYSHIYQFPDFASALKTIEYNRAHFPLPALTLLFEVSPLTARRRIMDSRKKVELLESNLPRICAMYGRFLGYREVVRVDANRRLCVVARKSYELILTEIYKIRGAYG